MIRSRPQFGSMQRMVPPSWTARTAASISGISPSGQSQMILYQNGNKAKSLMLPHSRSTRVNRMVVSGDRLERCSVGVGEGLTGRPEDVADLDVLEGPR